MKYLLFAVPLVLVACETVTEQTGFTAADQLCLALYEPNENLSSQANARAALRACLLSPIETEVAVVDNPLHP